jgi:hypothetical protein
MLEPYTAQVYVESPPSNDLPRQFDNRIAIEMSDSHKQRVIYLRPGDTVCFEAEYHNIKILAMPTSPEGAISPPEGDQSAAANEIQVKSSLPQPTADAGTSSGAPGAEDDDDTDDDDDLDATPPGDDDVPTVAVTETPSGPSRGRKHVLSSTPAANHAQYAIESMNGRDASTPTARAGTQKIERESMQPEDDTESQIVLPRKGQKPLKKYGGTPKRKREIPESSDQREMSPRSADDDHAAIEHRRGGTQSSPPKRKHSMSMSDEDEDDGAIPASTAPPLKRPRGRPSNASKAAKAPTKTLASVKTGKPRGRPSNASKAQQAEDAAEHLPSPGKLAAAKPRRKVESPDLNPRSSGTPQPGTPMTGNAPKKILLSNSKFADGKVAKAFLKQHGAEIVEGTIPNKRTNFICVVGNGDLATTAKVLRSLALGKKVVTDEWIEESMKEGVLLELDGYIHEDLGEIADLDRGKLFKGKTLFITNAQTKGYGGGFDSIKELATAVGAQKVESGSAKKGSGTPAASTIILGGDGDDPDAKILHQEGRAVYQKALLTQSVIKGELLVDDEELMWKPAPEKGKKGKK